MAKSEQSNVKQVTAEHIPAVLGELESLLLRQAELARQGHLREVETLAKQASELVERMDKSGVFESSEFVRRRGDFERIYTNLCLGFGAERAKIGEQLFRVRKGMKTVSTYRRNM